MICETYPRPCKHTKASGEPCRAFAVFNSELCYFHQRNERVRLAIHDRVRVMHAKARGENAEPRRIEELEAAEHFASLELPPLEDPAAVREWITAIIRAMAAGQLPVKMAKGMLYGLSLAMQASSLAIREQQHATKKDFVIGLFNQIESLEKRTLSPEDISYLEMYGNREKPLPAGMLSRLMGDSRFYGGGSVRKEGVPQNVPSPTGGKPSSYTPSEIVTAAAARAAAAATVPAVPLEEPETCNAQPDSDPDYPGRKPGEGIRQWLDRKHREREERELEESHSAEPLEKPETRNEGPASETIPDIKASAEEITSAAKAGGLRARANVRFERAGL